MRPVRLTLQAFGPYAERVVIDFRDAVATGLFGIYGQTGSGKSTIFSAMTFALFGEAARSEQDAPSLRSDHAGPGVLSEVEFVFEVGARRYVVFRRPEQMRPKARGGGETRSPHEAYLFDATDLAPDAITATQRGKIIAEKKVRDVDAAIVGMLGYGSDQFRQIVLLPQGRFEKFLGAKTKERLAILRELFDVSRYEALMRDLKAGADAAQQHVQNERALCDRQLSAEGFESTDALIAGIKEADEDVRAHVRLETAARAEAQSAERALRQGEAAEEKLTAAQTALAALEQLENRKQDTETLAERVRQAERARTLLDAEDRVQEAGRDVRDAKTALSDRRRAAADAREREQSAQAALTKQEQKSDQLEMLRRRKDDLGRLARVLDAAAESETSVAAALTARDEADRAFKAARAQLDDLQETRLTKVARLKTTRETEGLRGGIVARQANLREQHAAAVTYAEAEQAARAAQAKVDAQSALSDTAAEVARVALDERNAAERTLAAAQALHLATTLEPGACCPVCGATEHPAPATGNIENAGLDSAFRKAREAWQTADGRSRQAAETLAGLKATSTERAALLSGLARPDETAEALAVKIAQEETQLRELGPVTDIAAAEAAIETLDREIATLAQDGNRLRDALDVCRNRATQASTAHDSKLAEVPEDLRAPGALAETQAQVSTDLDSLIAARSAADVEARTTREAALVAVTERENAEKTLTLCQDRDTAAKAAFQTRLDAAALSETGFQALKPAIATLDADKAAVEEFWRRHQSAQDASKAASAAVEGMTPPDLDALRTAHQMSAGALEQATAARLGAQQRVDHLAGLHSRLADTLRRLDEAEAETGALRGLAALVNGDNSQKLTLEVFAIGAMFDQVLEATNLRFGPMTRHQYRLEREIEGSGRGQRGLGTQVFDTHTGKSRPTSTLSGGETFIAALALALGLADVVEGASGRVRLDTIFIDEGFGSLDTENGSGTLDQVLRVLNTLVSQNRAVGLISHVPLVQDAIPNGFYVRKGPTGSVVEERGLS